MLAKESEVTFPQMQGSKSDKEALIDITVSNPTLFKTLQRNPPQLAIAGHGDGELRLKGYGAQLQQISSRYQLSTYLPRQRKHHLAKPYTKHSKNTVPKISLFIILLSNTMPDSTTSYIGKAVFAEDRCTVFAYNSMGVT